MGLLTDCDYERTTVLELIQAAENTTADSFDLVHLTLDSGRELILAAITAECLDPMAAVLEGLRELKENG